VELEASLSVNASHTGRIRFKTLAIAMFTGLDAPTGVAAQGICATYFFSMDALN